MSSGIIGLLVGLVVTLLGAHTTVQRPQEGTLILRMPFTITPTLLNPSETTGQTAAIVHDALHDVPLKPLPGLPMALALAESWTESADGLTDEFTLHQDSPATMANRSQRRMSPVASGATRPIFAKLS